MDGMSYNEWIEIGNCTCSVQTESVADSMAPMAADMQCLENQYMNREVI
jgi:hypothetical protein